MKPLKLLKMPCCVSCISAGQEIVRDAVHITVMNPVMTGGFTRGSIRYSHVETVNANWVACGEFTSNRPLSLLIENPLYSVDGLDSVSPETLYELALHFRMKYGVSTQRDFFDMGKWDRPAATMDGILISAHYFELQATVYNGLIAPINTLLHLLGRPLLETYDAERLAESLSQESGIPKEELQQGRYFVTNALYEPGRGVIEFFFKHETFSIEDLYLLKLDLDIHHGGQERTEVSDDEEETRGAVTLANLNDSDKDGDTDGDGVIDRVDKDDPEILAPAWWWPFDEEGDPDMMKLVIRPIEPASLVNELKLKKSEKTKKVSLTIGSDTVKLWEKPSKEGTRLCDTNDDACTFNVSDLETIVWLEALEASSVDREIQIDLEYLGAKDTVRATATWDTEGVADLAIDSDNNNGFETPPEWKPSEYEDSIEDEPGKPGKFIAVNDGDANNDGIPDFADVETSPLYPGNQPVRFTPLLLEFPESVNLDETRIQLSYSASDPTQVHDPNNPLIYRPAPGHLRIWTVDGMVTRNPAELSSGGAGHYVTPETFYPASALGSERTITLFVEGVRESASLGDQQISVEVESQNAEGQVIILEGDTVNVTVLRVDLDIDSDNSDGFTVPSGIDYDEEDHIEDIQENDNRPGKLIAANMGDADNDNIPDFADPEIAVDAGADPVRFTPLVLALPEPLDLEKMRIRFDYSDSSVVLTELRSGEGTPEDPYVYRPAPGHLRIWTVDGSVGRTMADINAPDGGHFVQSGSVYKVADLGPGRTITLYVEGIDGSAALADQHITVEIDPNSGTEKPEFSHQDSVRATVIALEITEVICPNGDDNSSFTVPQEGEGGSENIIHVIADITPDVYDNAHNGQIEWTIEDDPREAYDYDSGDPDDPPNGHATDIELTIPPIPEAPPVTIEPPYQDGREWNSLSYRIKAQVIIEDLTIPAMSQYITQDEIDMLRQQYIDMRKNETPERDEFINEGNTAHFDLNDGACQCGHHEYHLWSIMDELEDVLTNLNQELEIQNPDDQIQGLGINSGYRCPIHNTAIGRTAIYGPEAESGSRNSQHIYGTAADVAAQDWNNNGRRDDDVETLEDAALDAEAETIPYSNRVHMDWRQE